MATKNNLKISLVQTKLHWENIDANIVMLDEQLKGIKKNSTHLIVLPEMFTTGFTMNAAENFSEMNGAAIMWMKEMAAKKNCAVCGSLIIKEDGKYFNRFVWIDAQGKIQCYDKRHLFRMANEHLTYTAGNDHLVVELNGWKIMPQVCYDLRFPTWSRNTNDNGKMKYDLLLYVANWPERRKQAWKQLLIARAIENQCYCIGLNRVGKDGKGINYTGDSAVIDFLGNNISKIAPSRSSITQITLELSALQKYRKDFPAHMDADVFELK